MVEAIKYTPPEAQTVPSTSLEENPPQAEARIEPTTTVLSVVRDAKRASRRLFPIDGQGPTFVQHADKGDPVPMETKASQYLIRAAYQVESRRLDRKGITGLDRHTQALDKAKKAVGAIIDLDSSRWNYTVEGGEDLMDMPLSELRERMRQIVAPVYEVVDPSLGYAFEGFNTHDLPHAQRVSKLSDELLVKKGASERERKIAAIAAYTHDLGNVFSRPFHPVMSSDIVTLMLPGIRQDHAVWKQVRQAIDFHDSDLLKKIAATEDLSSIERIAVMREGFSLPALTMLIGDKLDVGPERLSQAIQHMVSIDEDPHIGANNMGRSEGLEYIEEGDQVEEVIWRVVYDPHLQVRTHRNPRSFDEWKNDFLGIYPDRIGSMAYALFALFNPEEVKIRLEKQVENESEEIHETILRPGRIDEVLEELRGRVPSRVRRRIEGPYGGK